MIATGVLTRASRLERITAPSVEPVTAQECMDHVRETDAGQTSYISALLSAAVEYMDGQGVLGRAMITQTWRQYLPASPGRVALLMPSVQSVTAIGYFDADNTQQAATLSDFNVFGPADRTTVEPKPNAAWPVAFERPDAIWVDFTAGYGDAASDVPDPLKHAIKMLVSHWYEQRESTSEKLVQTVPYGFEALTEAYRAHWYG